MFFIDNYRLFATSVCHRRTYKKRKFLAYIHTDRQADRQTDRAKSTELLLLIKNIYTLWVMPRLLQLVTYILRKPLSPKFLFPNGSGY